MLYIVLYFAALLALLSWTRKSPGPLPHDKIAAKYTPCKRPKKPPKNRYSKNNITTQVNRKSPLLSVVLCCAALGTAGPPQPGGLTPPALVGRSGKAT